MADARTTSSPQRLAMYRDTTITYSGRGILTGQDFRAPHKKKHIPCRFEATQLADGTVLLQCDVTHEHNLDILFGFGKPWASFTGLTEDGCRLTTDGSLTITGRAERSNQTDGPTVTFRVPRLQAEFPKVTHPKLVRYHVTNFIFTGTELIEPADSRPYRRLPVDLRHGDNVVNVTVTPVPEYADNVRQIRSRKAIGITCTLDIDFSTGSSIQEQEEFISHLCYVLSVARGTTIQWIFHEQLDEGSQVVARMHQSRVTKPFCGLAIIADKGEDTRRFVEQAFGAYWELRDRYRLHRGVIDAYLDAKAENDYLQLRGVKLVVVLEMLKDAFLRHPDAPIGEFVVAEKQFAKHAPKIRRAIEAALEEANIEHTVIEAFKSKVNELNRTNFRKILGKLCEQIGLDCPGEMLTKIGQSRNSLVHSGDFRTNTMRVADSRRGTAFATPVDEFFFLLSFVDRLFLKLLGYSGEYLDWAEARTVGPQPRV